MGETRTIYINLRNWSRRNGPRTIRTVFGAFSQRKNTWCGAGSCSIWIEDGLCCNVHSTRHTRKYRFLQKRFKGQGSVRGVHLGSPKATTQEFRKVWVTIWRYVYYKCWFIVKLWIWRHFDCNCDLTSDELTSPISNSKKGRHINFSSDEEQGDDKYVQIFSHSFVSVENLHMVKY